MSQQNVIADGGRQRGGAADYRGPIPANQRVASAAHNMERPMQYEYSNEPEDEQDEDNDSETEQRNYVNELILQRSRNRHPAFTDDNSHNSDASTKRVSTVRPSSMYASNYEHVYSHKAAQRKEKKNSTKTAIYSLHIHQTSG